MSYATPADVEVELGRPASSATETAQWEAWLDRVERAIVRRFTQATLVLADQIALDDPTLQDVVDVEVAAVIRKIQNPQWGLTSVTRSVDDASVTERNENGQSGDPLLLTDDEWFALLPGYSYSGAFSTRPGFEADTDPVDWWS
jgi:hypothetical protein